MTMKLTLGFRALSIPVLTSAAIAALSCGSSGTQTFAPDASVESPAKAAIPSAQAPIITISSVVPADIPGGAPGASLTAAAAFAWQEFIALNWPAVPQTGAPGTRDKADAGGKFGVRAYSLAWHTYRGKVEIFPGTGNPAGCILNQEGTACALTPGSGYGYDAPPRYIYTSGAIPPASGSPDPSTPWINADENSEIGLNMMFAGVAAANPPPLGNQILFMAKANRAEYDYVARNGWWGQTPPPFQATATYVSTNRQDPPPDSSKLVSFPSGTIELKAAWRKLAPTEDASRYYTAPARYYVTGGSGQPAYVDDTLALVSLHIIHKTPTAPYFVFATFEQADNITDQSGKPVEDLDGRFIGTPSTPMNPDVTSKNAVSANPASPTSIQQLSPATSSVDPAGQLYYVNTPTTPTPQGKIAVNMREHAIPGAIIAVNAAAHQAISAYAAQNGVVNTPWVYYKLINVQSRPIAGKQPGVTYTGADAATFYQANSVVETDYNLQVFSGHFQPPLVPPAAPVTDLITDFNLDGTVFNNVGYGGTAYDMGGCMGCHGNAQVSKGTDFSFILAGGYTPSPETPSAIGDPALRTKYLNLFHH
jgi:hypothetical protein